MNMDDSLTLSTLLGYPNSRTEPAITLKLYDKLCHPRTPRIVVSIRNRCHCDCSGIRDRPRDIRNMEKLRKKLLPRWYFIIDLDNGIRLRLMSAKVRKCCASGILPT